MSIFDKLGKSPLRKPQLENWNKKLLTRMNYCITRMYSSSKSSNYIFGLFITIEYLIL